MEQNKQWVQALIAFFLVMVCTAQTAWPWETTEVDDGPVTGPSSLAVDGSDHVHIVYRDESAGELKYATDATGSWVSTFIEPSVTAGYPSIAVDGDQYLHIVCIDQGIKYLSNASGSWIAADIGVGHYPSIAVDASGHAHICYLGLYPWYATNNSGDWVKDELFTDFPPGFYSPLRTSIGVDSGGNAYLSWGFYMDYPGDGSAYYGTNASGSWVRTPLPLTPFEWLIFDPSVAIDASDHLHISYMGTLAVLADYVGIHLGHAMNAAGNMRSSVVTLGGMLSPLWADMVTDSTNAVHIIYSYLAEGPTAQLKYATNAQGAWAVSGPLADRIDGDISPPSIGVDSTGKVYISYIDTDNRLLVVSGMAEDLTPMWPGTPAEASAYGQTSRVGSSLFNILGILLVPIGAVILLRVLRRRE
jgi:hypothetical protein